MNNPRNNVLIAKQLCSVLLTAVLIAASAQAQTTSAVASDKQRDASRGEASGAAFRLSNLLAQVRRTGRSGFSLMSAGKQPGTNFSPHMTAAASSPVVHGGGTVGKISMWVDIRPNEDSILGDSIITQFNNNIGIGLSTPTSKLTVQGMIETTLGGVKFPDGTIQTTAAGGGGTVTSISATSPLVVTNPTTTPNISLGIVPAANGGTGLSSPGAAGQFLRSIGSAWTSAPLLAPDIPSGSAFYIHSSTSAQSAANFNIDGTGMANIFDAVSQYNLDGDRILGNAGTNNVFAGIGAGVANAGSENAFFGRNAGFHNTTGSHNTFVGNTAGGRNTTGQFNSFFGSFAGSFNSTGEANSFFGVSAGNFNTEGSNNSFFGVNTGTSNTEGSNNSFFGVNTGTSNTEGSNNSFFGVNVGTSNKEGSDNAFFGFIAGSGNTTGGFNSFVGRGAGFKNDTGSGNSFFGASAGFNNTTGQLNAFFGEGTGSANTSGNGNTFIGRDADFNVPGATGDNNTLLGLNARVLSGVNNSTAIGASASVSTSNTIVLGTAAETVSIPGNLTVAGVKNFKIDHPLEPETKFLYHAAIESSEVLNIYSGNVSTDAKGDAVVILPDWFEALNKDFRYQLTVVGTFAQAVVSEKIKHNRFLIKTSAPNVEVSWQVTGVRSDRLMREHPFKAEEDKPERERGHFLSPDVSKSHNFKKEN